jgi:flagellin
MGLRINQNTEAFNAYRNLSVTQGQLSKSLEKLSSGFRINRAADDAAGLAISEGLRSQIGGLKVAARNTQDGISVVQTAEGALTETHAILQRMRDLAVQSANDSNDGGSRAAIDSESKALTSELNRISGATTYNNIKLLDGTYKAKDIQVGYAAGDKITVDIVSSGAAAANSTALKGAGAVTAGTAVFTQGTVVVTTAALGAVAATAGTDVSNKAVAAELNADTAFAAHFSAAVDDAGVLKVTSRDSTNSSAIAVSGNVLLAAAITTNNAPVAASGSFDASALGVNSVDLTTKLGATAAITALDGAISKVSTSRANLGALQNRFEHTINNVNVAVENLSASESRIRDTDMAQEMVQFPRSQILSQAGTAMLAQANQGSQGVLQLLRG